MAVAFARAFVQLEPDMRTFEEKTKQGVSKAAPGVAKEGEKAGRGFGSKFAAGAKFALAGAGAFLAIKGVELFGDIIKEGAQAARTNRIVEQAIKSTGGAAHVSSKQIEELTKSIGNQAGVDDDVIKAGSAMLLTFRNIRNEQGKGNDIFDQANKTLVDMTAALHGGEVTGDALRKQAIQLGKALNDPVKGLTALQRVGVSFTEGQKKQITALVQSGHRLEAQKIILRELGKEFGGAAAASASPMQKLKARFDNFKEGLGTALLPIISTFVTVLSKQLLPALDKFATWFQERAGPAIASFAKSQLPHVIEIIKTFAAGVAFLVKIFAALPAPLKIAAAAVTAFGIALKVAAANPWTVIIVGLILLVGLIVKHWGTIKRVTLEVWGAVERFVVGVWHRLYASIKPILDFFVKTIPHAFGVVLAWVKANWPLLVGLLTGPIGFAIAWIIKNWTKVRTFLEGLWQRIWTTAKAAWNKIAGWFTAFFNLEIAGIRKIWTTLIGFFTGLWNRVWTGAKTIWASIIGWFKQLPGRILNALTGLGTSLYNFAKQALQKFWNGAKSIGSAILGWFGNLAHSIIGGIKKIFGIASPSSVFFDIGKNLMRGLINGIKSHYGATARAVGNIKYRVGAGVAQWRGVVERALRMEGLPLSLTNAVLYQMQTESGGNPNITNNWDINAQRGDPSRGLMQVIGSTFRAYHWPGTSFNIFDPLANVAAALNYARARYGPTLMRGGFGIGSGHGYAFGGAITEPIVGIGVRSGGAYSFGEGGRQEQVSSQADMQTVAGLLGELIGAVRANAQQTADGIADAFNGIAQSATQAGRYSVG